MRKQSVDLTRAPRSRNAFSPNLSLTFAASAPRRRRTGFATIRPLPGAGG
jgi:hypothetical protein